MTTRLGIEQVKVPCPLTYPQRVGRRSCARKVEGTVKFDMRRNRLAARLTLLFAGHAVQ